MTKACCCQQSRSCRAAFQNQICCNCGPVQHTANLRWAAPGLIKRKKDPGYKSLRRITRRRGRFRSPGFAGLNILQGDIGEGATNINRDNQSFRRPHRSILCGEIIWFPYAAV